MTKETLLKTLLSYDYVSFDLFDTLMFRTVSKPEFIHQITQTIYTERYGGNMVSYPIMRRHAESKARNHYRYEVNLEEIYEYLDYPEAVKSTLKAIEIESEIKNCVPNQVMVEVLQKCILEGKYVVITTDMYLPREVIEAILVKIGVSYQKLYLSCEERKTKKCGNLFEYVLEDLEIQPEQIIHIGDNLHSDIDNPSKYGIRSFEPIIDINISGNKGEYLINDENIATDHLRRLFDYYYSGQDAATYRIGFTVLGPFLYSFCCWLHKIKIEKGIGRMLFLARDGYLIYKCYRHLFSDDDSDYICLNKNLLRLPSLYGSDNVKNLIKSLPPRRDFSWKEICTHIGINVKKLNDEIINARIFDIEERILRSDILNGRYDEQLVELFKIQEFEIREQTELLDKYLSQNGFFDKTIGLVNNSMEGSTQILLEQLMNRRKEKIDVYGLQFTASPSCEKLLENRMFTFFGDNNPYWYGRLFRSCPLPLEHLVFEPAGTARKFQLNNKGLAEVIRDEYGKEKEDFNLKQEIQEFAMAFIREYQAHIPLDIEKISKKMFMRMLTNPCSEDASLIGSFWDVDVEKTRQINTPPHATATSQDAYYRLPAGRGMGIRLHISGKCTAMV